jgi:predicted nucleotidyltransferase
MSNREVLQKSRPTISVIDFSLAQITQFLAEKLEDKNVESAYLVGSLATGTASLWSDIDVVIVKETTTPFPDRALEFAGLFDLGVAVDILVYTPDEFRRMEIDPTSFWKTAMQTKIKVL